MSKRTAKVSNYSLDRSNFLWLKSCKYERVPFVQGGFIQNSFVEPVKQEDLNCSHWMPHRLGWQTTEERSKHWTLKSIFLPLSARFSTICFQISQWTAKHI